MDKVVAGGYPNAPDQASEPDEHRLDQPADDEPYAAEDYYEDGASRARRRRSMVLVMAIFALAVAGTAGAVGYRAMFGGSVLPTLPPIAKASNRPNKIVPASSGSHAKNNANGSQAGAATIGSKENLDSREEQPVTIEPPKPAPRVMSPDSDRNGPRLAARHGRAGCACPARRGAKPSDAKRRGGGCEFSSFCQCEQRRGSCSFTRWLCGSGYVGAQ